MPRISAYGSPAISATRKGGATDKAVGATATAAASDNSVRNAPTTTSFAQTAASSAPIDEGRVAAIREALSNGSYVIDTDKLAAKMIELDLGRVAS